MSPTTSSTVIIGGGIIGFSTAYYLALSQEKEGGLITIVNNASGLFNGASGRATSVLGDYGFLPEAVSLGNLSWDLHRELASNYKGKEAWSFSDIVIHEPSLQSEYEEISQSAETEKKMAQLPDWFRNSNRYIDHIVADGKHAARIDPRKFCQFLKSRCESLDVRVLLDSEVIKVFSNNDIITIVEITSASSKSALSAQLIPCHNLVIAAGPWSERVLKKLFPSSQLHIPLDVASQSGNYLRVKTPHWNSHSSSCDQIYLERILKHRLDISSFLDGSLYIGGYKSAVEKLPKSVSQVKPQESYIEQMKTLAASVLNLPQGQRIEVLEIGRAYLPAVSFGRPTITKLSIHKLLGKQSGQDVKVATSGGVFLNVSHRLDGITLGPSSSKVMSELIRGTPPFADISRLGLSDAPAGSRGGCFPCMFT